LLAHFFFFFSLYLSFLPLLCSLSLSLFHHATTLKTQDHGSLTGLVPAMYLNEDGIEIPSPDPQAGLYIRTRTGTIIHIVTPPNCLAFQIGETAQIHTGGVLQATPHAVRGAKQGGEGGGIISREMFALFMEPDAFGSMAVPEGRSVDDVQSEEARAVLPKGVRTLKERYKMGMNFNDFSVETFKTFYD
jgi:hypothetical protein